MVSVVQVSINAFSYNNSCFAGNGFYKYQFLRIKYYTIENIRVYDFCRSGTYAIIPIARVNVSESLEENTGMLFVFPEANYYSMWMKKTPIFH